MLSKSKIKYIQSLERKKIRKEEGIFVAEGNKLVADMLGHFECVMLIAKSSWLATQGDIKANELIIAEDDDIKKASFLKTPQDVIALFKLPTYEANNIDTQKELVIALDGIQDPGNLGTIVRLADWFGIEHIVCSADTTDAFAPKCVQSTMGALARVKVHYLDLEAYLRTQQAPVYGTFLDGENVYEKTLTPNGILMMGNEGNGISEKMESLVSERLFIPSYPAERPTSESLNVAIATAIACAEFRRREVYSGKSE